MYLSVSVCLCFFSTLVGSWLGARGQLALIPAETKEQQKQSLGRRKGHKREGVMGDGAVRIFFFLPVSMEDRVRNDCRWRVEQRVSLPFAHFVFIWNRF